MITQFGINRVTVAAHADDTPREIAFWYAKSGTWTDSTGKVYDMLTPGNVGEVMNVNLLYRYGAISWGAGSTQSSAGTRFSNGLGTDIYLQMPALPRADSTLSSDPNDFYVNLGYWDMNHNGGHFIVNGPDIRISGFEFRSVDLQANSAADRVVFDHNHVANASLSVYATAPSSYPVDTLFIYNYQETLNNNKSANLAQDCPEPWRAVKGSIKMPAATGGSTDSPWLRVLNDGERTGLIVQGGARRGVIKYNTVSGNFDGIGTGDNTPFDRYGFYGMDWHDNLVEMGHDDAFVPAQQVINLHIGRNRVEYYMDAYSASYTNLGPVYLYRNEFWHIGYQRAPFNQDGTIDGSPTCCKFGDQIRFNNAACLTYIIHNTFWTDDPLQTHGGSNDTSTPDGVNPQLFYLRNNVYRVTGVAWGPRYLTAPHWDEDYDAFATDYLQTAAPAGYTGPFTNGTGVDEGIKPKVSGVLYSTPAAYQAAATPNGAHSNTETGLTAAFGTSAVVAALDAALADPAMGALTLAPGSILIDAGTPVPNISDLAGVNYQGTAPDLGATEYIAAAPLAGTAAGVATATATRLTEPQVLVGLLAGGATATGDITAPGAGAVLAGAATGAASVSAVRLVLPRALAATLAGLGAASALRLR
ncbi:MAG: hypothetical protein ACTHMP_01765, partial [Thermomicrobiales bacterium]